MLIKLLTLNVPGSCIHCQLKFNMCFPIIDKITHKIFVSALKPTLTKVDVNAIIIIPKITKK